MTWNISACVGVERYILSTLTPEKYPASESEEIKDSCMWKFKQVKVNQSKTDRFMWKFKQVNQRKTEIDVCESLNKWATTNNISSIKPIKISDDRQNWRAMIGYICFTWVTKWRGKQK